MNHSRKEGRMNIKVDFNPFPELTTQRLNLRQLRHEDLNDFFLLKSDPRLLEGYNANAKTYEEALRKLGDLMGDVAGNESITWAITLEDDKKLIGTICLWNISEESAKAEVGYELMFEWQGKGIMQEALKAVIDYGFKVMGLQIIEAVLYPNNYRSVKLLERSNFIKGKSFFEDYEGSSLEMVNYCIVSDFREH